MFCNQTHFLPKRKKMKNSPNPQVFPCFNPLMAGKNSFASPSSRLAKVPKLVAIPMPFPCSWCKHYRWSPGITSFDKKKCPGDFRGDEEVKFGEFSWWFSCMRSWYALTIHRSYWQTMSVRYQIWFVDKICDVLWRSLLRCYILSSVPSVSHKNPCRSLNVTHLM